jgi:hypothetical protein
MEPRVNGSAKVTAAFAMSPGKFHFFFFPLVKVHVFNGIQAIE